MKKKIFAIIVAVIILIVTICAFHSCNNTQKPLRELLKIDPNIGVTEQDELKKDTHEMIEIPGYGSIKMRAGEIKQSANFENPAKNNCYFVVSLYLPNGREIFRSGLIPPGETLRYIELREAVTAGEYEGAVLLYDCYKTDDQQTQLNGARTITTLIFE